MHFFGIYYYVFLFSFFFFVFHVYVLCLYHLLVCLLVFMWFFCLPHQTRYLKLKLSYTQVSTYSNTKQSAQGIELRVKTLAKNNY